MFSCSSSECNKSLLPECTGHRSQMFSDSERNHLREVGCQFQMKTQCDFVLLLTFSRVKDRLQFGLASQVSYKAVCLLLVENLFSELFQPFCVLQVVLESDHGSQLWQHVVVCGRALRILIQAVSPSVGAKSLKVMGFFWSHIEP